MNSIEASKRLEHSNGGVLRLFLPINTVQTKKKQSVPAAKLDLGKPHLECVKSGDETRAKDNGKFLGWEKTKEEELKSLSCLPAYDAAAKRELKWTSASSTFFDYLYLLSCCSGKPQALAAEEEWSERVDG
ncbi:hypothetical protein ACLOJK_011351 [Asimina triloba]